MSTGTGVTRTLATLPRRTWPPPGVSMRRLRTLSMLVCDALTKPVVGRSQDALAAVALVGEHAAPDAGVAAHDVTHRAQRRGVVGLLVEAHPDLAGAGADRLVARDRAPHVRARVAHAGKRL